MRIAISSREQAMTARRRFLAGAVTSLAVVALPGCATMDGVFGYEAAVRRLLERSTRQAFARLTAPDGFWNSSVARINLPVLFGKRGAVAQTILSSDVFREKLQRHLNTIAEDGARRAAPVVADAVRTIGIANARAIIEGDPTAATTLLRGEMGPALVNAMIPELEQAMRLADDPVLGQALSLLAGVDIGDAAHALALEADNAIWFEIGAAEAEIREDPRATQDSLLIEALAGAGA